MSVKQRDLVQVVFTLPPNGKELKHPCIVISNDEINAEEDYFMAVMMTSDMRYKNDLYTFDLENEMLTKAHNEEFSGVRMHLISYFLTSQIIPSVHDGCQIKEEPFKRLIKQINRITFNTRPDK